MADEAQTPPENNDDEILELTDEVGAQTPEAAETPEEEEILTFGDEPTEVQETDNATIRHLREELKRAKKEASELRKSVPQEQPIEIGPEPDLWDDGIDGDTEKLKAAIREHDKKVAAAAARKATAEQAQESERKSWEAELSRYAEGKQKLGYADVDDAEETIKATLNLTQQAVLVKATDDPARVMYALAKNPDKLAELAAIQDPLKLAAKIAKLEGQLKMVKRRIAPDPDTPERGSAPTAVKPNAVQQELDKLEAEWERKGGDRTHIRDFKKKHGLL